MDRAVSYWTDAGCFNEWYPLSISRCPQRYPARHCARSVALSVVLMISFLTNIESDVYMFADDTKFFFFHFEDIPLRISQLFLLRLFIGFVDYKF